MSEKPLEERVDGKQWLPLWGFFQMYRDNNAGRPTIINRVDPDEGRPSGKSMVYMAYQGASLGLVGTSVVLGTVFGLPKLAEVLYQYFVNG